MPRPPHYILEDETYMPLNRLVYRLYSQEKLINPEAFAKLIAETMVQPLSPVPKDTEQLLSALTLRQAFGFLWRELSGHPIGLTEFLLSETPSHEKQKDLKKQADLFYHRLSIFFKRKTNSLSPKDIVLFMDVASEILTRQPGGLTDPDLCHTRKSHRITQSRDARNAPLAALWTRCMLEYILMWLTTSERGVILLRFGNAEPTLEQAGLTLNVTRERVKQIELRAIKKLRRIGAEASLLSLNIP